MNYSFNKKYLLIYSAVFVTIAVISYLPFIIRNKSFVWRLDGLSQHYLALIYMGHWLREIFSNFFIEHTFTIPFWDFSIGMGGDALTTFNYYGLGDPLCLLSAVFPEKYTVYLYNGLILLRLYLSGIFFSLYCFKMKQRKFETMVGAFTYIFCGYGLYAGTRHPFFLMPMMYFPLLLLGVEKIFRKESSWLFIISVFLSFISNFYFSYMLVVLTVIYVIVRFFTDKELTNPVKTFSKFIGYGLVGVLMSCVILLPVIIVFLGNSRSGVEQGGIELFNEIFYYNDLFSRFTLFGIPGIWTVTGFAPLSLISLILLLKKKGEYLYLKILFFIMTVILLVPALSKVMNGFSYPSNRWIWGFAFVLSYITVVMFRQLMSMSGKEKIHLIVCTYIYLIISICLTQLFLFPIIAQFSITAVLVIIFIYVKKPKDDTKKPKYIVVKVLVCILTAGSIIINSFQCFSPKFNGYVKDYIGNKHSYSLVGNSVSRKMKEEMDTEFCRFEQIGNYTKNAAITDDTNNVSFFWSLCDNHVGDYLKENAAVRYTTYCFQNLYKFTSMDAIFSVKYYFTDTPEAGVPYGYEYVKDIETARGVFSVYKNPYALPMGFTYSQYINREDYTKLDFPHRQEALLSEILLEEDIEGFEKGSYTPQSYEIPYTITHTDGAVIENNKLTTTKSKATVTLEFDSVKDCELYLNFTNLHYDDYLDNIELLKMDKKWDAMSSSDKRIQRQIRTEVYSSIFEINSLENTPNFTLATKDYQFYNGIHDFLMNLGYSERERNTITITIQNPGKYSFDSLRLFVNPLTDYIDNVTERKQNTLKNISIKDNYISGDITIDEPQILFLSVPYTKGFTAYVDGVETEILRANTWGMALPLDAGNHHIELKYHTRGLSLGLLLTIAGIASFVVLMIYERRKKKKVSVNQTEE